MGCYLCQGNEAAGWDFASHLSAEFKEKSNPSIYQFCSRSFYASGLPDWLHWELWKSLESPLVFARKEAQQQLLTPAATDQNARCRAGLGAGGGTLDEEGSRSQLCPSATGSSPLCATMWFLCPALALTMPSCQSGHLSPNPLSKWSGLARPSLLSDLVSGGKSSGYKVQHRQDSSLCHDGGCVEGLGGRGESRGSYEGSRLAGGRRPA